MVSNKKVVYFAGSIRGDRSFAKNSIKIVKFLKSKDVKVLSEHVATEKPIEEFAKKIGKKIDELTPEDIERQDISWIDEALYVIAEISGSSTGVGREIEYARSKHLYGKVPAKILCLYHKTASFSASPIIRGMTSDRYPNIKVREYKTIEQVKKIIIAFLKI